MADKNNYGGSGNHAEQVEEEIRKLKETLDQKNKELQRERRRTLEETDRLNTGAGPSNRRSVGESRGSRRESYDTTDLPGSVHQNVLNSSFGGASSVLDDSRDDSQRSLDEAEDDVMSPEHKQALRVNRDTLVDCMTPDDIFNDLISKHILTSSDVSRIKDKNTTEAINEELLNVLMKRSDRAFHVFVASLRRTSQGHLANKLEPRTQQSNKREVNVNLDCERVVLSGKQTYSCKCKEVEEQILTMAKDAFTKLRRRDGTPAAFEQWKKETSQTIELVQNSVETANMLKLLCRHGEITDLTAGSICLTIRCTSLTSCHELWNEYQTGLLQQVCQKGLVTSYLLEMFSAKEIHLSVRMSELEYLTCALELAYKEKQALQQKQSRTTPLKRRLRQRKKLQDENTGSKTRISSFEKKQTLYEIPVNILSSPDRGTSNYKCNKWEEKLSTSISSPPINGAPLPLQDCTSQENLECNKQYSQNMCLRSHHRSAPDHRFMLHPARRRLGPMSQQCQQITAHELSANKDGGRYHRENMCPYYLRYRIINNS